MAYTATKLYQFSEGNKIQVAFDVTADAVSGSVFTGLSVVDAVVFSPVSMATAAIKIKRNLSAVSAAANGTLMVSSAVNGDVFTVIAIGH